MGRELVMQRGQHKMRRSQTATKAPKKHVFGRREFSGSYLGGILAGIYEGWQTRAQSPGRISGETRIGYLKLKVYALARRMKGNFGLEEALKELAAERGKELKESKLKSDLHYAIIVTLLTEADLCRSEQARNARLLTYAERHRVPQEYLLGFTAQVDSDALTQKVDRSACTEPWFDAELADAVWLLYKTSYEKKEAEEREAIEAVKHQATKAVVSRASDAPQNRRRGSTARQRATLRA